MNTTITVIAAIVVLALVALVVWSVRSDKKLKETDPEAFRKVQLERAKNNPAKLRELDAPEESIKAAEEYQAKKAEEKAQRKAEAEERSQDRQFNITGPGMTILTKNVLTHAGKKYDITGASVGIENGAVMERVTATRFLAYSAALPPLAGAAAGALHKKDNSKVYVAVVLANGMTVSIPFPRKDETKARTFAEHVSNAAIHFAAKAEQAG